MLRRFIIRNLGAYYMLIACLFFAFTGAFGKILSQHMSSVEVVFFRNIVGLFIMIYSIYKSGISQKGGKPSMLIFRGVVGVLALMAFFYNVANMGLAEAFTYAKSAPIFLCIIASVFLNEKLSFKGWMAVIVGFIGILFIMQPNLGLNKADFMGLFNGFFAALAYTSVRELRKYYDSKIIVLAFLICGTLMPVICMVLAEFIQIPMLDFMIEKFTMPSLNDWGFILAMGITGVIFQIYMTKSYAASKKAGVVSAVSYSDIIFSMIIGVILGDSLPNFMAWIGIILVISSGIVVAFEK